MQHEMRMCLFGCIFALENCLTQFSGMRRNCRPEIMCASTLVGETIAWVRGGSWITQARHGVQRASSWRLVVQHEVLRGGGLYAWKRRTFTVQASCTRMKNDPRKAPATAQIGERVGKLLLWEAGRLRKVPMDATANDTRASRAKDGGPNHMAGLSSVTEASIEEASGACASLGQQGMPPRSPAAAEAEFTSPSETFFDGNLLGVEALCAESMAVAAAGDGAERVGGGVGGADGDGEQEPVVLGASAAVSSEEDREENPIQVR